MTTYEEQLARVMQISKRPDAYLITDWERSAMTAVLYRLDECEKQIAQYEHWQSQMEIRETDDKVCGRCGRAKTW